MKILVVGAETASLVELESFLALEGNRVSRAASGEAALALAPNTFDVALVCFETMRLNRAITVKQVQTTWIGTPILVLNVERGSKDVLPAGIEEMSGGSVTHTKILARLHAIVRRARKYSEPVFYAGAVQLNQGMQEVLVNGIELELTRREFDLLEALMMSPGVMLTKEALLTHLHGGIDAPSPKVIDVLIYKLRGKLAQAGAPQVIGTFYGYGYLISGVSKANIQQFPTTSFAPSSNLNG